MLSDVAFVMTIVQCEPKGWIQLSGCRCETNVDFFVHVFVDVDRNLLFGHIFVLFPCDVFSFVLWPPGCVCGGEGVRGVPIS